jgi:hypothetical protein
MSRFTWLILALFCVRPGLGTVFAAQEKKTAERPKVPVARSAEQVEAALTRKLTLDFVETPLAQVADYLQDQTGLLILLDKQALDDLGIGSDAPVTTSCKNMSLRAALGHMLRPLDLTWMLRNGALVITSPEGADACLETRLFSVTDLVYPAEATGAQESDEDTLLDLITTTVAPQSWDAVGGPGAIEMFRGILVVSQTRGVLDQVRALLTAYRQARKLAGEHPDRAPPTVSVTAGGDDAVTTAIERALDQEISLDFVNTPLKDVVAFVRDKSQVDLLLDRKSLDECGVATDAPISFRARNVKLRHGLAELLRNVGLTWTILDEVLVVMTPEEHDRLLVARAYPIADLLGRSQGTDLFGWPRRAADLDSLQDLISTTIAPVSWDSVGGPASIASCPHIDVLVVAQTLEVHAQIAELLGQLRQDLARRPAPAADKKPLAAEPTRLAIYVVPTEAPPPRPTVPTPSAPAQPPSPPGPKPADAKPVQQPAGGIGGAGVKGGMFQLRGAQPVGELPPIAPEKLMELVTSLIEPTSWGRRPDVYINTAPGRLIVRHTEQVHRQIHELFLELGVHPQSGPMSFGHMLSGN